MSKVSIKLMGGLGNYLFQIATAYSYGLKHNKKIMFNQGTAMKVHNGVDFYLENIMRNLEFNDDVKFNSVFNENGFHYTEIPEVNGSLYLNGYYQTEKYFKEHEAEIKELFSCTDEIKDHLVNKFPDIKKENTCSIHVRRGDYLKIQNILPVQGMPYFMKALKNMPKDSEIFVFSDDIEWCKQSFPDMGDKIHFVEGQTDIEDFYLQSMCKNNITSNSTFSWWSAWLNDNEEKIVVAPKVWFGPSNAHYDTKDVCPENWIRI